MSRAGRRLVSAAVGLGLGIVLVDAPTAGAHPLGNFSVNTSAALELTPDQLRVTYVVDSAELPTVQAVSVMDADGDGRPDSDERARYAEDLCSDVSEALAVRVGGEQVPLRVHRSDLRFIAGEAGLDTSRIECVLRGAAAIGPGTEVRVEDEVAGDRVGWHEVVVAGEGVTIDESNVPPRSPSDGLRSYPDEGLTSPLDVRSATAVASPGDPAADGTAGSGPGTRERDTTALIPFVDGLAGDFTDLVARQEFSVGVVLVAVLLAILLGSLHALAPGHGKTVMAAYLVGRRGTPRQALLLCASVTLTHTAGVLILGTVLTLSTTLASERVYPYLGALSGLIVATVGVQLWRRSWGSRPIVRIAGPEGVAPLTTEPTLVGAVSPASAHQHSHAHLDHAHDRPAPRPDAANDTPGAHGHDHAHDPGHTHPHGHTHGHGHTHPTLDPELGWRPLVAMGLAGGMVPSPSALVVLLGAIALGRTWFGVALVALYGLGMSLCLIAAGLLLIRLRDRLDRFLATGRGVLASRVSAWAPLVTASLVVLGGLWIAGRAAGSI